MKKEKQTIMKENKNNQNSKKQTGKKTLKVALIGLAVLAGLGATACGGFFAGRDYQVKQAEKDDNKLNVDIKENGISLKMAYKGATAEDPYGSYELTYTVTPAIYTDDIKAMLMYSDGSSVDSGTLALEHNPNTMKIIVHCKKAFRKTVTLKVYAQSNATVCATMTFDFREKITVDLPNAISLTEGAIPSITPQITSTGGTIAVDKNIKNVSYKWNAAFTDWVKKQTLKYYETYKAENSFNMEFGSASVKGLVGLADSDCATFFSTKFNAYSFLSTKGCSYTWTEMYSDDDSDDPWSTCNGTFYLGKANKQDFLAEFNGTAPIIDYSCSINGQTYTKTFGLNISAINVSKISLDSSNWVF